MRGTEGGFAGNFLLFRNIFTTRTFRLSDNNPTASLKDSWSVRASLAFFSGTSSGQKGIYSCRFFAVVV